MTIDAPFLGDVEDLHLTYRFSQRELRILARFFRQGRAHVPDGLEEFSTAVENAIYNSMSIDEAEQFYS